MANIPARVAREMCMPGIRDTVTWRRHHFAQPNWRWSSALWPKLTVQCKSLDCLHTARKTPPGCELHIGEWSDGEDRHPKREASSSIQKCWPLCTRQITQPILAVCRTMKRFKAPSPNVHMSADSYPHGSSYICKCNQSKPNISKQRHSMRQWWQSEETLGNRFWHQDMFLDAFVCLGSMHPSKFNEEPSYFCGISKVLGLLPMC